MSNQAQPIGAVNDDMILRRYQQENPWGLATSGLILAVIAGMIENAAVLTFSFDTCIEPTGFASTIASSYALVVVVFGIIVCHERLTKYQLMGMRMVGLMLLAF